MLKKILFQGDSITDAGRYRDADGASTLAQGCGYATLLAARIMLDHPETDCINRGISGNRVVDLYARWKIDALSLSPDLISILIGVNDTWHEFSHGNGVELNRFEEVYRMLLVWTQQVLPQVRLVLMEPFALRSEVVTEEFFADVAARRPVVRNLAKEFKADFVPLQELLEQTAAKCGDPLRLLCDGVHPAPAGAQLIAEQWLKAVKL